MAEYEDINVDFELDARGLICPEPLMLARNMLRKMQSDQILFIAATDPSTERDFNNLCRFMGHEMVRERMAEGSLEFWIKKGIA